MKNKYLQQLFLSLSLLVGANASASVISSMDTHTTSDGSIVNLSGLDWLSWDITAQQSRNAIENGFGGLIADGWRYATIAEYSDLLTSIYKTQDGWDIDNAPGGQWLYDNLYGTVESPGNMYNTFTDYNYYGQDGECDNNHIYSCIGGYMFKQVTNDWSEISSAWNHVVHNNGTFAETKANTGRRSSVLVRSAFTTISEPTTLAIFSFGLMGLASRRFKKQS